MYLNTQSGLTPALDAIGQIVQANQQNDAQLRGLAAGGVIPASTAPGPSIMSRLLGSVTGAPPSQPAPAAPVSPAAAPVASSAAGPSSGPVSPNAQAALAYFQGKGLSPIAAQGLVGGFTRESGAGLDPTAVNPNGGASGMAQWTGDRAAGLKQFAAATGRDPSDIKTQLDYAWSELNGPEKATLDALKSAANPLQATVAALGFERPEGWSASNPLGAKDFGKRLAATVGLGGAPASASAYAPQGNTAAGAPAAQAIASSTTPGGAAPMPQATADQANNAAPAPAPAPSAAAPASAAPVDQTPNGMPSIDQIRALIVNPQTRQLGLSMWQQYLSPKTTVFGKPGEVAFSNGRPTYQIPATPIAAKANETLVDPVTHQPIYTAPGKDIDIKQTGEDAYGNKVFSTIDKTTGQITPIQAPAGASGQGAANTDPNLHGQDFLATLNPTIAAQVQAYAEGRSKMPSGVGANSPFARQMRAAVLQYDPNFDASNVDARFKTRLDFSPGAGPNSAGVAITAGNTAIQHLGELSDAAEELQNGQFPAANAATHAIDTALGGNLAGAKFNSIVQKYVDEAQKFYKGTGGNLEEIKQAEAALSPNQSPAQLRTSIAAQVDLMKGKINALQDRWHQGMGPTAGDFPIIQPKSQAALDRIAGRAPSAPASPASATSAPLTPEQAQALAPGTPFIGTDGVARVRH